MEKIPIIFGMFEGATQLAVRFRAFSSFQGSEKTETKSYKIIQYCDEYEVRWLKNMKTAIQACENLWDVVILLLLAHPCLFSWKMDTKNCSQLPSIIPSHHIWMNDIICIYIYIQYVIIIIHNISPIQVLFCQDSPIQILKYPGWAPHPFTNGVK